jgi:hypothetical protein
VVLLPRYPGLYFDPLGGQITGIAGYLLLAIWARSRLAIKAGFSPLGLQLLDLLPQGKLPQLLLVALVALKVGLGVACLARLDFINSGSTMLSERFALVGSRA